MKYWTSGVYARRFILPAAITLALVVITPMVFLWYISFTDYDLGQGWSRHRFVGLQNFRRLFSGEDRDFWPALRITLVFLLGAVTAQFTLGLGIALLFHRRVRLKRLWMSVLLIPLTITPAVIGLMWKLIYNTEYGVLNFLLRFLGLKVNWLGPEAALVSVILVDIWQWTPFVALILYAGLQALPDEPFESATVDGATGLQVFRYITLPLLKPMITVALLLRSIDALKIFDTVYVLTRGGPGNLTELLSLHIYRVGFQHTGWIGRSSAAAIVLLFLATAVVMLFMRAISGASFRGTDIRNNGDRNAVRRARMRAGG